MYAVLCVSTINKNREKTYNQNLYRIYVQYTYQNQTYRKMCNTCL